MKRFATYTLWLFVITLVFMVTLDFIYTSVFNHGADRNKLMWVRAMEGENLDYIILGSSRANYSIQPNVITSTTGKKGFNLGMNSSNIIETSALLEKFLEFGTTKSVYIQVDPQYRQEYPDPVGEVVWMPYVHESEVYDTFKDHASSYTYYRYVPFYRYQKFAARLGFRDVLSSALGSGYDYESTLGYMPRYGTLQQEKPFVPDPSIVKENPLYTKLISFCNAHDIKVYFFTAPYYKFKGDITMLEDLLPQYTNFSDSLSDRLYFSDQIHLNTKGAQKFTEIFAETYFSKQ